MTTITLAGIETTIGAAIHKLAAIGTRVATAIGTLTSDIDKAAPVVEEITAAIPQAAGAVAAEKAVIDILNAVDAAVVAAGTAAAGGLTVSLPGELVAAYNAAKASITADIKAL
jgi:ABC-type transporter Mla subunit MlaD